MNVALDEIKKMRLKKYDLFFCFSFIFILNSVEAVLTGGKPSSVASPSDSYAGATNPANAVYVGDRYDGGFRWQCDNKRVRIVKNTSPGVNGFYNASYRQKNTLIPDCAINKTFKTELFCKKWEWALSFISYSPFYNQTFYDKPIPYKGKTPFIFLQWIRCLSSVFAFKLNEQHSFGVSFDMSKFRTRIQGQENSDNPLFTVAPGHVSNNGYANTYGCTATIGWTWKVTPQFSLGLVYQPQAPFHRIGKYKGFFPQHGLYQMTGNLRFGIIYTFNPEWAFVFDIYYYGYNRTVAGNRLNNALGVFNIDGSKHGAAAGLKDQYIFDYIVLHKLNSNLTIKAIYVRRSCAVPRSQTSYGAGSVNIVTDYVSMGLSYKFWKKNEISLYYAHGFEKELKGRNSISPHLGGGEANLKQTLDFIGFSIGYYY